MKFSELLENTIKSFEQDLDLKIYAEFLKRIPIQNFSEAPAAVSKSTLYINKDWFENVSQKQGNFVLLHESLHWFLDHCDRLQGRDGNLWNISTDLVINEGILHNFYSKSIDLFEKIENGIYINTVFQDKEILSKFYDFYKCSDDKIYEKMNSEMNYLFLEKEGLKSEDLTSFDNLIQVEDGFEMSEDLKELKDIFDNNSSKSEERDIGGNNSKARIPEWLKKIKTNIQQLGMDRKVDSFSKSSRRTYIIQKITKTRCILPGAYPQFRYPNINVHIDSSPSIPLGILKKVMEDLQVMVKELRFGKLHFYFFCMDCFDTGLELKNGMKTLDLKNIVIPMQGGTCLIDTFEKYRKKEIVPSDICIFITDGKILSLDQIKDYQKPAKKIFWIILNSKDRKFRQIFQNDEIFFENFKEELC